MQTDQAGVRPATATMTFKTALRAVKEKKTTNMDAKYR